MKENDGLTFSGPVEPEKGQIETPTALTIPSWRGVHASKEELRRISSPSYVAVFVMLVLVVLCGVGLAIILNQGGGLGWVLVVSGIVLAVAIVAVANRRERMKSGTPESLYFGQREVAEGLILIAFGTVLFLIWGEHLIATAVAVCSVVWGLFMVGTTVLD